jgi:predicted DNA-binding transcriptional regulator YafY
MSGQNTLYRTLEMMTLLSRPGGVTVKHLAEQYECSVRTIQRTIRTIIQAGYVVEEYRGRYRINKLETKRSSSFDIGDLLHFSKEEAELLNRSIRSIRGRNAIKENLTRKLYSLYGLENVANNLVRQQDSEQVKTIIEAIQGRFQIQVNEYTWSTANRGLQSVVIEPIEFAFDYSRVWAFYPKQRKNFLLRLSGINGVKALYTPYEYKDYHRVGYTDFFRGYGFSKMPLKMVLNRRAYGFLLEEFPLAGSALKQLNPHYFLLDTEVCDLFPVARFFLGLPGDMEVKEPDNFLEYIQKLPEDSVHNDEENMEFAVSLSAGKIVSDEE